MVGTAGGVACPAKQDVEEPRPGTVRRGLVKRLHVLQPNIRNNRKHGGNRPVCSCQTSGKPLRGDRILLKDEKGRVVAELKYTPEKPLKCGAVVYLETHLETEILYEEDQA